MNRLVLALCVMALAATSIDASPVCFPIAPAFPADQKGEDLARQLEALLEQYGQANPSVRQAAQGAYAYAMQCELDFFQAAWEVGA